MKYKESSLAEIQQENNKLMEEIEYYKHISVKNKE